MMSARRVGSRRRDRPEYSGIGILTERDVLNAVGAGLDPDAELVAAHRSDHLVLASPEWTLEQAAAAMVAGNFRHLVVIEGAEVAGLLSMRDIVRCWVRCEGGRRGLSAGAGPRLTQLAAGRGPCGGAGVRRVKPNAA